ncbi:MAG: XRE family transcriptional regulator [Acidobacteria bacterium]|nr:MAG: XRE family transcriptional regulator [Acidobacteriota bacterium]
MVSPAAMNMTVRPRKRKKLLLVGSRIRKLRKERSETQLTLASKVGIQQSDLCRMETGEYKVSLETLFKILSVFEMNIAEFFHEELAMEHSGEETEFLSLFRRLEREDQQEVTDFLRFKVYQNVKGEEEEEAVAPTSPEAEQKSG